MRCGEYKQGNGETSNLNLNMVPPLFPLKSYYILYHTFLAAS